MFFLNCHKVDGYNIKIINNTYILSECMKQNCVYWGNYHTGVTTYLLRKVISFVMEIVLFLSTVVTALPKKKFVSTYSCFLNESKS